MGIIWDLPSNYTYIMYVMKKSAIFIWIAFLNDQSHKAFTQRNNLTCKKNLKTTVTLIMISTKEIF